MTMCICVCVCVCVCVCMYASVCILLLFYACIIGKIIAAYNFADYEHNLSCRYNSI